MIFFDAEIDVQKPSSFYRILTGRLWDARSDETHQFSNEGYVFFNIGANALKEWT